MSEHDSQITLVSLQTHARTDAEGAEKEVLSLHDRILSRTFAPPVAWFAIKLGLSANFVTALSIIVGLAATGCLAVGSIATNLCAAALLQLSYILDCADGDIARATGTASIDGYLRDTMRHYLIGPLIFCAWTMNLYWRHNEYIVVVAGLLATFFATRVVGDLEDRVVLEGLIKRLKKGPKSESLQSFGSQPQNSVLNFLRGLFLRDLALMNWLTLAVIADAIAQTQHAMYWRVIDYVFFALAGAQVILKTGGLLLLWRRGVSGRIEAMAAEIESARNTRK